MVLHCRLFLSFPLCPGVGVNIKNALCPNWPASTLLLHTTLYENSQIPLSSPFHPKYSQNGKWQPGSYKYPKTTYIRKKKSPRPLMATSPIRPIYESCKVPNLQWCRYLVSCVEHTVASNEVRTSPVTSGPVRYFLFFAVTWGLVRMVTTDTKPS
jgi:hypothetical protein